MKFKLRQTLKQILKSFAKFTLKYFTPLALALCFSLPAIAQKKMDLEDMAIKGELHGDNRLRFFKRQKNQMKNYIKFRTNFRDVIGQEIPNEILTIDTTATSGATSN